MEFKPCYSEIRKSDKSILFLVHYAKDSTVHVENVYNSISYTYMGITINCFTDTLRGLLRTFPDFLEVLGHDPRKDLKKLGFVEVEPTELELMLYKK